MLHFQDQVFPPNTEAELSFCFSLGVQQRTIKLNVLSWLNIAFTYHDHDKPLHTFTLSFLQRWTDFFQIQIQLNNFIYKSFSNQKIISIPILSSGQAYM